MMNSPKVSVIIPTRNRPASLAKTLHCLNDQDLSPDAYEIIVVDDGSTPAVSLSGETQGPACVLLRLEGVERSAARNQGAGAARADVLVFVDDDIRFGRDFLSSHLRAHEEWPDVLAVGAIRLPVEAMSKPFGRFRDRLEQQSVPKDRGLTSQPSFCTAANMSIPRVLFLTLGGFDVAMKSAEDQDLALRHSSRGGQIVFLPEAAATHDDDALDIRSYCQRTAWGSLEMTPFYLRYPDWKDNVERERVNGPLHWDREPLSRSLRKVIKSVSTLKPVLAILFLCAKLLERLSPGSRVLEGCYRLLLGAHIFRGYREGIKRTTISQRQSALLEQQPGKRLMSDG